MPGYERLFVATCHCASGLQIGHYSGALVDDLALGQYSSPDLDADLDLAPYAPERFLPRA
jgi:glycine/D-amino acid oxidase-like deaminating enzyme